MTANAEKPSDQAGTPSPKETNRGKPFRWPIGLGIVAVGTIVQVVLWNAFAGNRTFQIISAYCVVPTTLFLVLLWWLLFSGLSRKARLGGLGGIVALIALLLTVVRLEGFYGDMTPRLAWRWTRSAESRANAFWNQQGEARGRLAEQTSNEPLTITADDWPGFRGIGRDGIVPEARIRRNWQKHPPELIWKHPVGKGWSSFAVVDGLAFTQEQRGQEETVVCYQAATGREVWSHANRVRFSERMGGVGPRATPTVAESRVYALGATGILDCLQARTGKLLWSRNILEDAGTENLNWGMAGSPLVYENLVVVNPGGRNGRSVIAYDRKTGEIIWASGRHPAGYAGPRLETIDGVRQVLVFGGNGLAGYHARTGRELWWTQWQTQQGINVAQPVVQDGQFVLVSSSYGQGSMLYEVKRQGGQWMDPQPVWDRPNIRLKLKFSDAVLKDGYLYGLDEVILTCLDFRSGRQQWKGGRYGYGQVLLLGDLLLVQAESGEIALVEASPEGHREIARFPALEGKTWNQPAFARGRLYLRNAEEAACYDLRPVARTVHAKKAAQPASR